MTREKEDQERLLVGGPVDFKLQAWTPLDAAGGWLEGRQPQDPPAGQEEEAHFSTLDLSIRILCDSPTEILF